MVEMLSVVILALVMTRLQLADATDRAALRGLLRDGGARARLRRSASRCCCCAVLEAPFDTALTDFFDANTAAIAHGRNIVNVILVDFRGLDTLGEISVVMTAGIAILALIRVQQAAAVHAPAARRRA